MRRGICAKGVFVALALLAACGFAEKKESASEVRSLIATQQGVSFIVRFIDVGQGDATLLSFPNGKTMLVDTGGASSAAQVIHALRFAGIARIDTLVISHAHDDHIDGLRAISDFIPIGKVVHPDLKGASDTALEHIRYVRKKGILLERPSPMQRLDLDSSVGIWVVGPHGKDYSSLNDSSLVLFFLYGKTAVLLAGDAEAVVEKEMLEKKLRLRANVLKVGHHGSNTSSSQEFLNVVRPEYAVVSVGKGNAFGLPDAAPLKRLQGLRAKVYRTDTNGSVVATLDGVNVVVGSER